MIGLKAITPPRGTLSASAYKKALQTSRGMAEVAGLQEARATTKRWKHKPTWTIERDGDSSRIVTYDPVFFYQDTGTKPHIIRARKKRALYWAGARHPVRKVNHPGTKAQHYSERIAATMQKQYQRMVDAQFSEAAT